MDSKRLSSPERIEYRIFMLTIIVTTIILVNITTTTTTIIITVRQKSRPSMANTYYQGGQFPSPSRSNSLKDDKSSTVSVGADSTTSATGATKYQLSSWQLSKRSIARRTKIVDRVGNMTEGTTASIVGSITDGDKAHILDPQEFFRMSKKRKSKFIHSLRNKPIEVNKV